MKKIIRKINRWLFVRGIGNLPRQYANIKGQAERFEFAAKNFGINFADVLFEKEMRTSVALHDALGSFNDTAQEMTNATHQMNLEMQRTLYSINKFRRAWHNIKVYARKKAKV